MPIFLAIWRGVAQNVQDNIGDAKRAVAAWQRVLDLAPGDAAALSALIPHYRSLGRTRELIAALEAELRIAPAWMRGSHRPWRSPGCGKPKAIARQPLRPWSACSAGHRPARRPQALARLRIDEPSVLLGATDVALASLGEDAPRQLRSAELQLVPSDDALGRFLRCDVCCRHWGPTRGCVRSWCGWRVKPTPMASWPR